MCGPGCCRREAWNSPETVAQEWVAGCLSGIACHCRHRKSERWHKGVPVSGGLRACNSCSTGNPWSKRLDSRGP